MFAPTDPWTPENCPIERAIAAVGEPTLDAAGDTTAKVASDVGPTRNEDHWE
jgi:hypothetical protein